MDGGALRDGLGCGGEGGVGPTLVWYCLGAGAVVEKTTAAGAATTAAGGAALEPSAGGGEERRTRGRKALPLRVFAILKSDKEEKGVGGFQKLEMGSGMKRKEWTLDLKREEGQLKGQG